jgi:hypothetical protein
MSKKKLIAFATKHLFCIIERVCVAYFFNRFDLIFEIQTLFALNCSDVLLFVDALVLLDLPPCLGRRKA